MLGEPFFTLGVASIDFADFELDLVANLSLELVKEKILDRFADHAGAEQADTDGTRFVHGCHGDECQ